MPTSFSSPSSDSASDSPSDNSIHPYDCFPRWVYSFPSAVSCLISNSVDVPGVDTNVDSDKRSDSTDELRSYSDEGSEIRLGFGMLLFGGLRTRFLYMGIRCIDICLVLSPLGYPIGNGTRDLIESVSFVDVSLTNAFPLFPLALWAFAGNHSSPCSVAPWAAKASSSSR